ncbi:MAG: methyltransferase [Chromatiales bacterium]|jgi:16S rRNA (guanine1207-N2)-methyltransferase
MPEDMPDQLDNHMQTPFGDFTVRRLPQRKRELLRGWDAADEYLLDWLAGQSQPNSSVLIANDSFGALAVALHVWQPQSWSDSWLSQQATRQNLRDNAFPEDAVLLLNSLELPQTPLDLVLLKLPKQLALLEYQLLQLKPLLHAQSRLVVAGMHKNMGPAVWKLLEQIIGPTETSLAKKKARLVFVTPDLNLPLPANPYPTHYSLPEYDLELSNHANVFAREKLDIGSRFLLQHMPHSDAYQQIIDLACGNGVLGIRAAQLNEQASLTFIDESFMAVASARLNFERVFDERREAQFSVSDSLTQSEPDSADLVLCNPPFHLQHVVSDWLALRMFRQAASVLRTEGELWIVGNRHLAYHHKLKRWFGQVRLVASNRKFVILCATQPRKAVQQVSA